MAFLNLEHVMANTYANPGGGANVQIESFGRTSRTEAAAYGISPAALLKPFGGPGAGFPQR